MNHPLEKFSLCPVCGSDHFVVDSFKSKRCEQCGFVYFANAAAAAAAFICRGGTLLVARRGKEPAAGTLDLPGGFIDMGETAEEGMAREVKEETGLEVKRMEYLFSLPNVYVYSGMEIHTLDLFYRVEVADDAVPHAGDDAAALQWVPLSDVRAEAFGLKSISRGVKKFLERELDDSDSNRE